MSADQHMREAESHRAAARRARADESDPTAPQEEYECGDTVMADQSTSGTERLHAPPPCWKASGTSAATAAEEERIAAEHRDAAQSLRAAEKGACASLSDQQRRDSPFDHRADIAAVTPIEQDGTIWGARVVFKKVRNLDAAWLQQTLDCHRARAAVTGWDPKFMSSSPAALPDTTIEVTTTGEGIAVSIRAKNEPTAAAVRSRAEALLK
jgi:hypothetical protein